MDELSKFCNDLKNIIKDSKELTIEEARLVVKYINEFLYTNYPKIGTIDVLGRSFQYISDFHKYWEKHYEKILNAEIDIRKCEQVADALHEIFLKTHGKAFYNIWDKQNLPDQDVCRIRLLTANQEFRGSRTFADFAKIFKDDHTIFDENKIFEDPGNFLKKIKILKLSQNDKRIKFAQKIAEFILNTGKTPYELISYFNNDVSKLREALINCQGAGYGPKKTDMFLRDMVVLGIWKNVKGFEFIDVASDENTMKVALRVGILKTSIPLVSSFLDIFCHQYGYIAKKNADAWRVVWKEWKRKYPNECVLSPCLIDYFIYNVVGKQFCKEALVIFKCKENDKHIFKWHSSRNKTCQICLNEGIKKKKADAIDKVYPCKDPEGKIAILKSDFVSSLRDDEKFENCPFKNICDSNGTKFLQPPKSISIEGETSWKTAYTSKDDGGGGLMA